jgi:hypothetical protein
MRVVLLTNYFDVLNGNVVDLSAHAHAHAVTVLALVDRQLHQLL